MPFTSAIGSGRLSKVLVVAQGIHPDHEHAPGPRDLDAVDAPCGGEILKLIGRSSRAFPATAPAMSDAGTRWQHQRLVRSFCAPVTFGIPADAAPRTAMTSRAGIRTRTVYSWRKEDVVVTVREMCASAQRTADRVNFAVSFSAFLGKGEKVRLAIPLL